MNPVPPKALRMSPSKSWISSKLALQWTLPCAMPPRPRSSAVRAQPLAAAGEVPDPAVVAAVEVAGGAGEVALGAHPRVAGVVEDPLAGEHVRRQRLAAPRCRSPVRTTWMSPLSNSVGGLERVHAAAEEVLDEGAPGRRVGADALRRGAGGEAGDLRRRARRRSRARARRAPRGRRRPGARPGGSRRAARSRAPRASRRCRDRPRPRPGSTSGRCRRASPAPCCRSRGRVR